MSGTKINFTETELLQIEWIRNNTMFPKTDKMSVERAIKMALSEHYRNCLYSKWNSERQEFGKEITKEIK